MGSETEERENLDIHLILIQGSTFKLVDLLQPVENFCLLL